MKIGKREQIVLLSIGTLLLIFIVHVIIFKPKAEQFARIESEYQQGQNLIKDVENAPANYIANFNAKTRSYEDQLTSVVANLRLETPEHYDKPTPDNVSKRFEEVAAVLGQLVRLRSQIREPVLSFLDDRPVNQGGLRIQMGWNLPPSLPNVGTEGAIWDTVVKIYEEWNLLQNIPNPQQYMQRRAERYNPLLTQLGINPMEVSDWVVAIPRVGYVFFNDEKMVPHFPQNAVVPNPYSTNRLGPMVPSLKKLWMSELIWHKRDPNTAITKDQLRTVLEVNLPSGATLLSTRKQLQALIDVITLAQQNGIVEISRINLMKPNVALAKSFSRAKEGAEAKATPTPTPTPAAPGYFGDEFGMMGMEPGMMPGMGMQAQPEVAEEEKIGTGTGIEIWFKGRNSNVVKFLFDITHVPRTYALDDLQINASPGGVLETSATVELVTSLDTLKKEGE